MSWSWITRWALAASITSVVTGQQSGWQTGQVNATMCSWQAPRAAIVRDTLYIDGGYLYWAPGMADGSYAAPTEDNNPLGLIYYLNFSTPFNTSSNISEVMQTMSKVSNGNAANNVAPNFYDGAMLANDDEFFLYGGLLKKTDVFTPPHSDDILGYQLYQYGIHRDTWIKGPVQDTLPGGMTRYLTFGGAANAPSENKAYYFGGMRSPTWGEIYSPTPNATINPTNVSNTLITLDLTTQNSEIWHNVTLQDGVEGRASPELVWVPVGAQGILVALGGVTFPNFDNPELLSQNEQQSKIDSPVFMSTIDIYDIAGDKWYKQPTIDGPGQLAQGCAVVAVAQDQSSYNIYYYGGYNGLDPTSDFNDDVWILSLPSFVWKRVLPGTSDHARAGHKCVKPYADQMIVVGGYPSLQGENIGCVQNGLLQIFNLTEAKWMQSYDPAKYNDYGVPEMIHVAIGGDATGGATMTTPTPTGWATPDLAKVFQTTYPASKLTTYYPYPSLGANDTRLNIISPGGGGTPSWVAPVLGVVLGLVFLSALVVAVLLYRRRKLLRKRGTSEGTTDDNGNRIISWIRGQDSNKAPTVTTEDTPTNTDDIESRVGQQPIQSAHPQRDMVQVYDTHEMPDTPLVELMDTSPPVELGDTGLTPSDIIHKHTHFANPRTPHSASTPTNPSSFSHYTTVSQDHGSISSNSLAQPRGSGTPAPDASRPDSPPVGTVVAPSQSPRSSAGNPRMVSDLSGISARDQAHLRQISDASASDAAGTLPPTPIIGHAGPITPPGPVSPPSAGGADGREPIDYMSVHGTSLTSPGTPGQQGASPLRRSVFYESKDDLGEDKG